MSGGHLASFKKIFQLTNLFALLLNGLIFSGVGYGLIYKTTLDETIIFIILSAVWLFSSLIIGFIVSNALSKPSEYLAQAIFHISPHEHLVAAPDIEKLRFGKELVATLTRQIYDYAATSLPPGNSPDIGLGSEMIDALPVSVIGLDSSGVVKLINKTAESTFNLKNPMGLGLDSQIQMKFTGSTLNDWIQATKNKSINASTTWQKVEISSGNGEIRSYFDIAGVFRQSHPSGVETILVLFNHDEIFTNEENALNLIALSVHEIRTPLTILRGYIEVLREELSDKVDEQSKLYIDRLSASSENLAAFMANILSVAKADQNQLALELQERTWGTTLSEIIASMQTRSHVRGKEIKLTIADNMPTVAVDTISINEVITNLLDNAIKYSTNQSSTVWVDSRLDTDGSIRTTVRDEGVGIPESVVPHLFTRFYRNRRNRAQVAGTGLGLFISKEIVSAHHGNIWITSKEGEGTTVGFTLIPFSRLDDVSQKEDNNFTKVPHGWIKNHSMQRR